jgi:hypothetical protein
MLACGHVDNLKGAYERNTGELHSAAPTFTGQPDTAEYSPPELRVERVLPLV